MTNVISCRRKNVFTHLPSLLLSKDRDRQTIGSRFIDSWKRTRMKWSSSFIMWRNEQCRVKGCWIMKFQITSQWKATSVKSYYPHNLPLTYLQKFPKKVMQSPYMAKGMTSATPMTTAMEMYNWLYDSLKKIQRKQQTGTLKQNLERFFKNIDSSFKKKILK